MWLTFFTVTLIIVAVLYVPGYFFIRSLGASPLVALCSGPLISVLGYVVMGAVYQLFGTFCTGANVLPPVLGICLLAFAIHALWKHSKADIDCSNTYLSVRPEWLYLLLYVIIGLAAGLWILVYNLDTPLSFSDAFDNGFHLNVLRSLVDSGKWSCLGVSQYLTPEDAAIQPLPTTAGGFYPAGWHITGALVISLTGAAPALVENALNYVFSSLVFPTSMFFFLGTVFHDRPRISLMAAVITPAFSVFPWGFITFGPLFPNLAGYAILPSLMAIFILSCNRLFDVGQNNLPYRIPWAGIVLCILGIASAGVIHPNGVFLAVVLLAPYLTYQFAHIHYDGHFTARNIMGGVLAAAFVFVVWTAIYYSPIAAGPLSDSWSSFSSPWQTVVDIALISLVSQPTHLILAFLVVCGIIFSLKERVQTWCIVSYLLTCVQYYFDAATDGFIKSFITGFWYSDSHRIAAGMAIAAMPLVAMGLELVCGLVTKARNPYTNAVHMKASAAQHSTRICVAAITAILCALPHFGIPGLGNMETPVGYSASTINEQNSYADPTRMYSFDEENFVRRVLQTIPEGARVINIPDDGSAFAYGADGLNTYYRNFRTYANGSKPQPDSNPVETDDSQIIRTRLSRVSQDTQVQQALKNVDAEYVLVLDQGDMDDQQHLMTYDPVLWTDITDNLRDDTPGFGVVLSEGDMRLYKITAIMG